MLQEALRVLPQAMEDAEGRALQEADLGGQDLLVQPFVPVTLGEEPLHCTVLPQLSTPGIQDALSVIPQLTADATGRSVQEGSLGVVLQVGPTTQLPPEHVPLAHFVPVTLDEEPLHCTVLPQLSTPGIQDALSVIPQLTADATGRSVQEGSLGVVLQVGPTTQLPPEHVPLAHFVPVTLDEEPLHCTVLPQLSTPGIQDALSVIPQLTADATGRSVQEGSLGVVLQVGPTTQLPPEHVPLAHFVPVTLDEEPLHCTVLPQLSTPGIQDALSVIPQLTADATGRSVQEGSLGVVLQVGPTTQLPPEHVCPAAHAVPVPVQVLVGALLLHLIAEQLVVTPIRQLSEVVLGIEAPQATEEALAQDGAGYQEAAR